MRIFIDYKNIALPEICIIFFTITYALIISSCSVDKDLDLDTISSYELKISGRDFSSAFQAWYRVDNIRFGNIVVK